MPTGQEYAQALRNVTEWVESTDREIIGEIDAESEDGESISGYVVSHGSFDVVVLGNEEEEFFKVQYAYLLAKDLITRRVMQEGRAEIGEEYQPSDEEIDQAEEEIRSAAQDKTQEEMNKLRHHITQILSVPECGFQILPPNSPLITGFQVTRKMFVYEEDFSSSDFNRSVQTVVSVGLPGKNLLKRAFGMVGAPQDTLQGSSAQTEGQSDDIRGFQ